MEEEVELPPLSAWKMTVALAISLVGRAYSLGAVTDHRRQTVLQGLQRNQAASDRAVGQLIEESLPFCSARYRYVSGDIWRFRTAVEEIEDAIDEINYRMLEEEVGNPISKFVKRKLLNKVTRLDVSWSSLRRLRNAIGKTQVNLDQFDRDFMNYLPFFNYVESNELERYGYPSWLLTAEDVWGRRRKKEDLVQWLTKDTAEGIRLSICALVGMGGVGKTTLANNVSQEPRVVAHFDFIVWVDVPYDFNAEEMMTVILARVSGIAVSGIAFREMSFLENSLRRLLKDKKLLLILDNVRGHFDNGNMGSLKKMVTTLKDCEKGSKILMTTKQTSTVTEVDKAIGAASHIINLNCQLPSRVGSEAVPEISPSNVASSSPKDKPRYPSWIGNGGIVGRNREREQIVQWLTMDTAEDNPFSVFALVGMAGMGKTTIANIVCQDPRVLANFMAIVWVPVSVSFDTEAMARIILETITGRRSPYSTPSLMLNLLTETLRYRKVFLILDDVWEDGSVDKWEILVAPLRVCKKGSKILLTTRMQSVVDVAGAAVGAPVEYLRIGELNETDNLMLFKSRLPFQLDSGDYDNLLLIGEQILEKIGGCPLVTSLVASWLGSHMDTYHWNSVLQNGWHHLEEKCIIFSSLRLSYDCLPTQLQTCFRYFSLFSKGYKYNKVELAKMWAGSGLTISLKLENLGLKKAKYVNILSAEDVGEEHFDVLVRKSFFDCMLETETSDGKQPEYYVLHNLMHDLAEHVSKGECARVDCNDLSSIRSTTRHLSVGPSSNLGVVLRHLKEIPDFTHLRTLIIQIEFGLDQETELVLVELLKKSKSLRLLYLGVPSLSCTLDIISSLIHLRYLFLLSCDECHLQKVFELYHLQVFKLEYLTTKGVSCIDTHSLRCLRSLHVPDNRSLRIQNIGRLTLLKELHGFEVVKNYDGRLSALGNLRSLCQLTLRNLQNILNVKEVVAIKLKDKHYLKLLSLSWDNHLTDSVDLDGRIIDNLEPNKELQLLHIHGYSGVRLPFWIQNSSLSNLVSLELEYCMKWKSIPSLKELTSVKHLKLENLFQLEYIGTVLEQQLEANESENAWLPPFLSTLTVRWCPNLKEIPDIPCTLELLIIKHVQLAGLPRLLLRYTGQGGSAPAKSQLGFLHIESCAQLTSLNTGLLGQQEQLHSLKTLVLRHCERLQHLPISGFAELCHLNSLEIVACPVLKYLKTEDHLLPVSLRNLHVNPCGDIMVSVLMSLQNLTALRSLTLFNCSNIEELPSEQLCGTLNNLNEVSIARCKSLLSLGGLGAVASLRVLSILCCNKLSSSYTTKPICTFKLQKLTTDRQALLLVEPLRSLKHTRELHINDDYTMESLPGHWLLQNADFLHSIEIGVADSLRSLPFEMGKLGLLQSLSIERAPQLQSLPQLPASLNKLTLLGCDPRFLKCYERDVGSDWGRIAHIANVDIQAISEGMSYDDDDRIQGLVTNTSNPYQKKYIVID